jgi:HSP20 family molecular chaperone IbpA
MYLSPFYRHSIFDDVFDDYLLDRPTLMDFIPSRRRLYSPSQSNKTWTATLRLTGYKPEEVKVERGDDNATVKVHAQQGSGDDYSEIKKTIHVPDNVDREHVDVDLSRESVLVVRAPYKQNNESSRQLMTFDPFAGWTLGNINEELRTLRENMIQLTEQSFPGSMFPTFVQSDDGVTRLNMDFDLRGYKPEEITVSHVGENVTVEARHDQQHKDGSSSFKHFKQVFTLPKNVKGEELQSKLMSDGHLRLQAPCELKEQPQQASAEGGQNIPVQRK